MKTYAIIPSGGDSKRFGGEIPKQYLKVNGKEVIAYTLEIFQNCDLIDEIIIAAKREYFDLLNKIKDTHGYTKVSKIIEGGKERQDSVYNGLSSIAAQNNDLIAVHDAARPLLPQSILSKALKEAKKFDSVVVALKVRDTLIKGTNEVKEYVNRNEIYYAQTPQIFSFRILFDAMRQANEDNFYGTDESMIVKRAGYNIKLVDGSLSNFKITAYSDFELFKSIITN